MGQRTKYTLRDPIDPDAPSCNESATIHPSAIVDEGAQIGEGSRIWHWVHVCGGARIGRSVSLGQNVFVGKGRRWRSLQNWEQRKASTDNVTLEEGVLRAHAMVFTNVVNPRALIDRKDEF